MAAHRLIMTTSYRTWTMELRRSSCPLPMRPRLLASCLPDRILLLLDVANASAVSDKTLSGAPGVLLKSPSLELGLLLISSVSHFFSGSSIFVLSTSPTPPTLHAIRELRSVGAIPVLPTSQLTLGQSSSSQLGVTDAFLAPLRSDRPDGLFPTVVSSYTQGGRSLGLVYSSRQSIVESILSGKGVYHSRRHGLWRKGDTSGATQDVIRINLDCDTDSLEFSVIQNGAGFCHLNRPSCFGELDGLSALESTLKSRLDSAPEGSYTSRLFNDPELLRSKIMEEAEELCNAETREQVAFEAAADLLYFYFNSVHSRGCQSRRHRAQPRRQSTQGLQKTGKCEGAVALKFHDFCRANASCSGNCFSTRQ